MNISYQKVGEGHFTHRLDITAQLGLPPDTELKVVFSSASRNDTAYHIFDQHGTSMSYRRFTYCFGLMNMLTEELNILLEEFGLQIGSEVLGQICVDARRVCEGRYGNGIEGGDVIVTIV